MREQISYLHHRDRPLPFQWLAARVVPSDMHSPPHARADQLPAPQGARGAGGQAQHREDSVLPHRRALPLHPKDLL